MTGRGLELTLSYGLLDWQNFANDKGPVAFVAQNFNLIDHATRVELAICDLTGQQVRVLAAGRYGAGYHEVAWDGTDAAGRAVASRIAP